MFQGMILCVDLPRSGNAMVRRGHNAAVLPLSLVLLLLMFCFQAGAADEPSWLAVMVDGNEEMWISGNDPSLLDKPLPPASTFKMVLAWAALESRTMDLQSQILSEDAGLREIGLHEAMKRSSNDFFIAWAKAFGVDKLRLWVERSGFFVEEVGHDWLGGDEAAVVRAGDLKIAPRQLALFCRRLADGELASSPELRADFDMAMVWQRQKNHTLYGKTGTWGGAAWLAGWVDDRHGSRTVLVVVEPYRVPHWQSARERVIKRFEEIGVKVASGGKVNLSGY